MSGAPLPSPFRWEGGHVAADLDSGRVLFSTRRGGVSEGPFASLNVGRLTADDPANVDANRERLADAVGVQPHEQVLRSIELLATEVVPRVTERLAAAAGAGPASSA